MALTSPDNIWTPDPGDSYHFTVSLGGMADSIQDVVSKKANYGVGTSAEMNAALSQFPDGALWYNVSTSSEWRKVDGVWADADEPDTLTVPISPPFTLYGSETSVSLRKTGKVVEFHGVVTAPQSSVPTVGSSALTLAFIPPEFRPYGPTRRTYVCQGSGRNLHTIDVFPGTGEVTLGRYGPGNPGASTWPPFALTWTTD